MQAFILNPFVSSLKHKQLFAVAVSFVRAEEHHAVYLRLFFPINLTCDLTFLINLTQSWLDWLEWNVNQGFSKSND